MRLFDIKKQTLKARTLYLQAIASIANIDGSFSKEEKRLLKKKIADFNIPDKRKYQILEGEIISTQKLEEIFDYLRTKKLHHSFFLDMISMAVSDGILQQEEKSMLAKLQKMVGVSLNAYYNLVQFSQLASQKSIVELSDPMFYSCVQVMFDWAQETRVKLFFQTTFSVVDEVDHFLKKEYQT